MAISEGLRWRVSDSFSDRKTTIKGTAQFLNTERSLLSFTSEKHGALLDYLRQLVVSLGSEASKHMKLEEAEALYHQMQEVLEELYADPLIWARAQDIHEHPAGSEYHMVAEMCRDIAKYYQKVGALTGNTFFNEKAIRWLTAATQLAGADSSVAQLAQLEKTHLMVATGKTRLAQGEQLTTFDGYMAVVDKAEHAGGVDRVAAASWLMMEVARKSGNMLLYSKALSELRQALSVEGKSTARYLSQRIAARMVGGIQRVQYVSRSTGGIEFMLPQLEKSHKVKRT